MKWNNGSGTGTKSSDNIFVDTVKAVDCKIAYGEKKSWQSYADDISLELTLDIGKDFKPKFYIGGNLKVDEVSGNVVGWSTAYKIKLFFDAIGLGIGLEKNKPKESNKIPEGAAEQCLGREFKRLKYKSTKQKPDGTNIWKEWQQVDSVKTTDLEFKDKFRVAVQNKWIKDFLHPDDEPVETATETEDNLLKDLPL